MTHCYSKIRVQLDVPYFYLLNLATFAIGPYCKFTCLIYNMNLCGIYTILFTDCPQFWGGQTDLADPGAQPSKSRGRSRKSDCDLTLPSSCGSQILSDRHRGQFLNAKNTLGKTYIFFFFSLLFFSLTLAARHHAS